MPVLAQQTTTTAVPRIVGDPLPAWLVIAAGVVLLAMIVGAALLVRRGGRGRGRPSP